MERHGHERISTTKEPLARVLYELWCQCPVVRFEERAKEWGPVARLASRGEPERKRQARNRPQGRRGAAWVRAESRGHDPEPGDLGLGRLKRNESYVEDR